MRIQRALLVGLVASSLALLACEEEKPHAFVDSQLSTFGKLGLGSFSRLKAAAQPPEMTAATPRDAEIAEALGDEITAFAISTDLVRRDPDNLELAFKEADKLISFGDAPGALEKLDAIEARQPLDKKSGNRMVPVELLVRRCATLRQLNRLEEAQRVCEAAILAGARVPAERLLTRIHLARGDGQAALGMAQPLTKGAQATADDLYTYGLALEATGHAGDAKGAYERALQLDSTLTAAEVARTGPLKPIAERLAAEDRGNRAAFALRLARCWHFLTELDLDDRAKRCAQESDKLDPGRVDAQRVLHLMEHDPAAAAKEADSFLAAHQHADLFAAKAAALAQLGKNEEARAALDSALALDPCSRPAWTVRVGVCRALGDSACVDAAAKFATLEAQVETRARRSVGVIVALIAGLAVVAVGAGFALKKLGTTLFPKKSFLP